MFEINGDMGVIGVKRDGRDIIFFRNGVQFYEYTVSEAHRTIDGVSSKKWWMYHLSHKTWFYPEIRKEVEMLTEEIYKFDRGCISVERFEFSEESGESCIEWVEENNGSKVFCSVPVSLLPDCNPYVMLRFAKEKVRDDLTF